MSKVEPATRAALVYPQDWFIRNYGLQGVITLNNQAHHNSMQRGESPDRLMLGGFGQRFCSLDIPSIKKPLGSGQHAIFNRPPYDLRATG